MEAFYQQLAQKKPLKIGVFNGFCCFVYRLCGFASKAIRHATRKRRSRRFVSYDTKSGRGLKVLFQAFSWFSLKCITFFT